MAGMVKQGDESQDPRNKDYKQDAALECGAARYDGHCRACELRGMEKRNAEDRRPDLSLLCEATMFIEPREKPGKPPQQSPARRRRCPVANAVRRRSWNRSPGFR